MIDYRVPSECKTAFFSTFKCRERSHHRFLFLFFLMKYVWVRYQGTLKTTTQWNTPPMTQSSAPLVSKALIRKVGDSTIDGAGKGDLSKRVASNPVRQCR